MYRAFQKVAIQSKGMCVKNMRVNTARPVARWFSGDEGYGKLSIPTDAEQQGGRRKEELDAEAAGGVGFNRDPIVPTHDQGTKEKPILVPSQGNSEMIFIIM